KNCCVNGNSDGRAAPIACLPRFPILRPHSCWTASCSILQLYGAGKPSRAMKMPGWIRRRRLGFESGSEMLPELHDFRPDDCGAVTLERILREVFLVIGLRFIPGGCRYKLRDNRILIDLFFRERRDDFLCDPLLLGTMIKDGRSILSADIVSLAV